MKPVRILAVAVAFVAATGCHLFVGPYTTPPVGPGTDYPCGYTGILCSDTMPKTCCPMNHACKSDKDGPYCASVSCDPSEPECFGTSRKRVTRSDLL